jgi:hypothetical protein
MSTSPLNEQAPLTRAQELLLDFLRDREAHDAAPDCPVCKYNLRALTKPVCPECGHDLLLTVGAARHPFGWLLFALAPGFFSGIAAFFLSIPVVISQITNDPAPSLIVVVDFFGWCSGVFAIVLALKRHRFLALRSGAQRWWAIVIWLIHVTALGAFLLTAFLIQ